MIHSTLVFIMLYEYVIYGDIHLVLLLNILKFDDYVFCVLI